MSSLPDRLPDDASNRPQRRGPVERLAPQNGRIGQPPQREAPTHTPGEMGFQETPGRDEQWQSLSESVRERMWQHTGRRSLVWWAHETHTGRMEAVLFGDQALCFADPRVNPDGKPVYSLSVYHVDPASLQQEEIVHRVRPGSRFDRVEEFESVGRTSSAPPPDARPGDAFIHANTRKILGHLPPRAQVLLQAPFLDGQQLLRQDFYYYGLEGGDLDVFCMVLAGPRDVTAVEGTRTIPDGHTESSAHWDLTAYRARVTKRRGA